jgi:hypothetical protein
MNWLSSLPQSSTTQTSFLNGPITSPSVARLHIALHDVRDMPSPPRLCFLFSLPKATCLPPILEVTRLDPVESTKHRDPDGVFPEFWWGFSFQNRTRTTLRIGVCICSFKGDFWGSQPSDWTELASVVFWDKNLLS